MDLSFIIWNVNPEVFPFLPEDFFVHPRWYGILFASGFVLGFQIVQRMLKNEGYNIEWMDSLLVYMLVGTVLGARLGHVFFYDWAYYQDHLGEILMVWKGGLASHGASVGILIALYLWSKKVSKKSMLWIVDRVVVVVAIAGCLIRLGNLMNSEIVGKPTESDFGFVFTWDATNYLKSQKNVKVEDVEVVESSETSESQTPITFIISFEKGIPLSRIEKVMPEFHRVFTGYTPISEDVKVGEVGNFYKLIEENGELKAEIYGIGVTRHPTQLYEALFYALVFILLMYMYPKWKGYRGKLFGAFLIGIFGWRIFVEFFKENQVAFEDELALNMGQYLSIPLVLAGIYFIVTAKKAMDEQRS